MRLITFILIYLLGPVLLSGCSPMPDCSRVYTMPDGTRCGWESLNYGHRKFSDCNNGRTYLDPAYYSEANVCK
jgi:hypothetical protein